MPKIRPTPTPSRTSERISARFVAAGVGADLIRALPAFLSGQLFGNRQPREPRTEDIDCRNFCAATLIHIIGHLVMDVEGMMSGHEREVPMRIISDY